MKRFSDNPTDIGIISVRLCPKMFRSVHSARREDYLFLYLKSGVRYVTIVVVVGRRQAVKAKDFDSLIEGSNPAGPAQ